MVPWSSATRVPFAPGNRPNRLSKLRFSLMMNTTCLMGHFVGTLVTSGNGDGRFEGSEARGPVELVQAAATRARTAGSVRNRTDRRVALLMTGSCGAAAVYPGPLARVLPSSPG